MDCNIDSITNAAMNLNLVVGGLRGALEGEWQDEVSSSYELYIEQCSGAEGRISDTVSRMKSECETLSSIDVDTIVAQAESTASSI